MRFSDFPTFSIFNPPYWGYPGVVAMAWVDVVAGKLWVVAGGEGVKNILDGSLNKKKTNLTNSFYAKNFLSTVYLDGFQRSVQKPSVAHCNMK